MEKIKAYGLCLYKANENTVKVLLCKSVNSKDKWGFLKGVSIIGEKAEETAIREFKEESNISIEKKYLENFFIQKNEFKNIGIFLVNYTNVMDLESYFNDEVLYKKNLSSENSDVRFFDIKKLPLIKKKQKFLTQEIIDYLS